MTKSRSFLACVMIILLASVFAACGSTPSATGVIMTPGPGDPPSPTPFMPATLTPTPNTITLWLSPLLPAALQEPLLEIELINGLPVEFVPDPASALIRAEPEAEVTLSSWVYALVAPFPTLVDGMAYSLLQSEWREGISAEILVSASDAIALSALLGVPGENALTEIDGPAIVDRAWEMGDALAIVPFDELEPRWKVLHLDGQSPLSKDLSLEAYPLVLSFGLSGDPDHVADLQAQLEWPTSNRDPDRMTVLVMTGVTALSRATAWQMDIYGMTFPARDIIDWLLEPDFTHTSNEVSVSTICPPPDPSPPAPGSTITFCSSPRHFELLEYIDLDLVELTGNHNMDYGAQAYLGTLEMYREAEIEYFGGGENIQDALSPVLIEHNGNRLAFLGCNSTSPAYDKATSTSPGAMPCSTGQSLAEVTRLRAEGYLIIFTFQWTEYYTYYPLGDQADGFRRAVDAGAAIVSGSQAHQPQSFEFYKDGFIHYGLGNLFFDQMWSLPVRQEFIDRHVFYDGRHISTQLYSALLESWAKPRPMTDEERAAFLADVFAASGW